MEIKQHLASLKARFIQIHPFTKWMANEWGWVTPGSLGIGAWGLSEYLAAMVLFCFSGFMLVLKAIHWETPHKVLRGAGVILSPLLIFALCWAVNIQRGSEPLSKVCAKWQEARRSVPAHQAPKGTRQQQRGQMQGKAPTELPLRPRPQEAYSKQPKSMAIPAHEPAETAKVGSNDKAEVTLSFVQTDSPAISLHNVSNTVASNIRWGVGLWDTTNPDSNWSPLRIPVKEFDWIKPGKDGGPEDIFSQVSSQLRPGDVVVGTAFVDCPVCAKGHTYLVEITWGQGGWYAEWPQGNGNPAYPASWSEEGKKLYFTWIEDIPIAMRIPIMPQ